MARVKVAPSALGLMLQQITDAYDAWTEIASSAGFPTAIPRQPEGESNE